MSDFNPACTGKVPYPSKRVANESLKRSQSIDRIGGRRIRTANVYPCAACGSWHVGHVNVEDSRMKRRAR